MGSKCEVSVGYTAPELDYHMPQHFRQFLSVFWVDEFGFLENEVPCEMFCTKLVDIIVKDEG